MSRGTHVFDRAMAVDGRTPYRRAGIRLYLVGAGDPAAAAHDLVPATDTGCLYGEQFIPGRGWPRVGLLNMLYLRTESLDSRHMQAVSFPATFIDEGP
jgi:hypothetical protein